MRFSTSSGSSMWDVSTGSCILLSGASFSLPTSSPGPILVDLLSDDTDDAFRDCRRRCDFLDPIPRSFARTFRQSKFCYACRASFTFIFRKIDIVPNESLDKKKVILIDDVLNSGRTLMHAAAYLLHQKISKMNTIVLVDRRHRLFPIKADWVGLTLSTTLQEHIRVNFEKDNILIYLE